MITKVGRPEVMKARKHAAKRWGEVAKAFLTPPEGRQRALGVAGVVKAPLNSASGLSGGYLVPQELRDDLMAAVAERAFFRPRAHVMPMKTATLDLPYPDAVTVTGTAGVPSWFGGMQFYWQAEAQTRNESEPQTRLVELRANELTGFLVMSKPFLQDAGAEAAGSWLRGLIADGLAWFEDYSFFFGLGDGQPLGVVKSGASVSVTRAVANQIAAADVQAMYSKLLPRSYKEAYWLISPSALPQLQSITNYFPNLSDAPDGATAGALYSRPVVVTDKLPALGSKGDLILVDPSLYVIGDRGEVSVDFSDHVSGSFGFLKNQTVVRVVQRVDGRPMLASPVTLQDQSTSVSSCVILNSNPAS